MLETGVVEGSARGLAQFKNGGCKVGVRPMLSFSGSRWESETPNKYTLAKSMFTDFFRGGGDGSTREVDVEGLQMLISFMVGEEEEGLIRMRVWRIETRRGKEGGKVPRVEVVEMGPRMDLRIGRYKEAEAGMWKETMRRGKGVEGKVKKNVETDRVGDQIGRIHLGRQDLGELQSRKMKGLKRARDEVEEVGGMEEEEEDMVSEDEVADDDSVDGDGGVPLKRQKVA